MPKQLRVRGHTLPYEGRVKRAGFLGNGTGFGKCSCGASSRVPLPDTAARQRWHRDHKADVLARPS